MLNILTGAGALIIKVKTEAECLIFPGGTFFMTTEMNETYMQSAFLLYLMPLQNQGEGNGIKYLTEDALYNLWSYHDYQVNTWRTGLGLRIEFIIEGNIEAW